jgi:hypothetical protein
VALEIRGKARFVLLPCCKCEGLHTVKNANFRIVYSQVNTNGYIDILEIHMAGIKMAMTWLLSDVSSMDSGDGGATP